MRKLDSFWNIPPIQDAVARHLTSAALYNCIQVSHSVHACFIRFLWRDMTFWRPKTIPRLLASPALPHNQHYIRKLCIKGSLISILQDHISVHGPFPTLTTISMSPDSPDKAHIQSLQCVDFAAQHSSLQCLTFEIWEPSTCDMNEFKKRIIRMCHLKVLSLELLGVCSRRDLIILLQACSGLKSLAVYSDPDEICEEDDDPLDDIHFPEMRLQKLMLQPRGSGMDLLLIRLLEHCPLLEDLEIEISFDTIESIQRLAMVMDCQCRHLKRLQWVPDNPPRHGMELCIQSCPSLSDLTMSLPEVTSRVMLAIMQHGQTLESLVLPNASAPNIKQLFHVLHACPALTRLETNVEWCKAPEIDWVCSRLVSLTLNFTWPSNGIGYEMRPVLDALYGQLARLTRLQSLTLTAGIGFKVFTDAFVQHLEQLSGLQDLGRLRFTDHILHTFKDDQIDRILEMWPRLWSFSGLAGSRWKGRNGKDIVDDLRAGMRSRRATLPPEKV